MVRNIDLTLRRQNVNFFTFACVCAVLTMKEVPQAPGTPQYPNLKFYEEFDFDTFECLKSTHRKNVLS